MIDNQVDKYLPKMKLNCRFTPEQTLKVVNGMKTYFLSSREDTDPIYIIQRFSLRELKK